MLFFFFLSINLEYLLISLNRTMSDVSGFMVDFSCSHSINYVRRPSLHFVRKSAAAPSSLAPTYACTYNDINNQFFGGALLIFAVQVENSMLPCLLFRKCRRGREEYMYVHGRASCEDLIQVPDRIVRFPRPQVHIAI